MHAAGRAPPGTLVWLVAGEQAVVGRGVRAARHRRRDPARLHRHLLARNLRLRAVHFGARRRRRRLPHRLAAARARSTSTGVDRLLGEVLQLLEDEQDGAGARWRTATGSPPTRRWPPRCSPTAPAAARPARPTGHPGATSGASAYGRIAAHGDPRAAPPRRERVEPKNLFTGWVDVDLTALGRGAGAARRRAAARGRPAADRRAHLAADAGDPHRRTSRSTPATAAGSRSSGTGGSTSGTTARCRARTRRRRCEEYGEEQFMLWRRSYDIPPPPIEAGTRVGRSADPRYATLRRDLVPRTECLKDVVAPACCRTGTTRSSGPAGRRDRARRRARQLAARAGHAPRRAEPTRRSSALNIPTGQPLRYDLDDDCSADQPGRELPRPEAAADAAAAVAAQGH